MFRESALIFCLYFFTLTPYAAIALTQEQKDMMHTHFEKVGIECIKDNAISEEDIKSLRSRQVPTGENAPCFLACIMRKTGLMDDKGMVEKETALELAKSIFNDEEELKTLAEYLHSCSHVNTEAVGDGEKGCERAIKSLKCMLENASQFGFDV